MTWLDRLLDPCKNDREALQARLKREKEERIRKEKFLLYAAARKLAVDKQVKRQ